MRSDSKQINKPFGKFCLPNLICHIEQFVISNRFHHLPRIFRRMSMCMLPKQSPTDQRDECANKSTGQKLAAGDATSAAADATSAGADATSAAAD